MSSHDIFKSQLEEAQKQYPSLVEINIGGTPALKGIVSIVDRHGKHWDDYEIEIHCSERFPDEFPRLFETSGKIPRIGDWHVYEDTGSCCTKIPPEEILRCKKGITVTQYINEEVLPYLFNQTHRRVEGYYINGEYSHGGLGLLEYYSQKLNTKDDFMYTLNLLKFIAMNDQPNRTSICFCGSGSKFRHCHKEAFIELKSLGKDVLVSHYLTMMKTLRLV